MFFFSPWLNDWTTLHGWLLCLHSVRTTSGILPVSRSQAVHDNAVCSFSARTPHTQGHTQGHTHTKTHRNADLKAYSEQKPVVSCPEPNTAFIESLKTPTSAHTTCRSVHASLSHLHTNRDTQTHSLLGKIPLQISWNTSWAVVTWEPNPCTIYKWH